MDAIIGEFKKQKTIIQKNFIEGYLPEDKEKCKGIDPVVYKSFKEAFLKTKKGDIMACKMYSKNLKEMVFLGRGLITFAGTTKTGKQGIMIRTAKDSTDNKKSITTYIDENLYDDINMVIWHVNKQPEEQVYSINWADM